jgi:MFS superfamily sulfate permease-like transporter
MRTIPKRVTAKGETPVPRARDHEHVGRISTQTTIFVLIAVALILYEIHWTLPPFVLAGLLAYIVTTAIDWASARSRLIMSERRRNFLRS